jgi:hypothetical protein
MLCQYTTAVVSGSYDTYMTAAAGDCVHRVYIYKAFVNRADTGLLM